SRNRKGPSELHPAGPSRLIAGLVQPLGAISRVSVFRDDRCLALANIESVVDSELDEALDRRARAGIGDVCGAIIDVIELDLGRPICVRKHTQSRHPAADPLEYP